MKAVCYFLALFIIAIPTMASNLEDSYKESFYLTFQSDLVNDAITKAEIIHTLERWKEREIAKSLSIHGPRLVIGNHQWARHQRNVEQINDAYNALRRELSLDM